LNKIYNGFIDKKKFLKVFQPIINLPTNPDQSPVFSVAHMKTLSFFLLCLFTIALSKEWYISQFRGDDSNSGTKLKPLQTLTKAVSLATDGDSIKIEIGVYKQSISIKKSLKLIGIPEQNSIPLLSGKITFTCKEISISNLNVESTEEGFVFDKCDSIKVSNVNFGPMTGLSMMDNKVVTFSDVVIRNTQGRVSINRAENVIFKNVQFRSTPQCTQCTIILNSIKTFMISHLIIQSSGIIGLQIDNSNGIIENSTISGIIRTPNQHTVAGGMMVSGTSNVITKNLDLLDNQSSVGAGFYCGFGASLNMNGGRIQRNKGLIGAAGECDQSCSFFQIGVDVKDNVQHTPSKCRGL
jgi:hypothetical protein